MGGIKRVFLHRSSSQMSVEDEGSSAFQFSEVDRSSNNPTPFSSPLTSQVNNTQHNTKQSRYSIFTSNQSKLSDLQEEESNLEVSEALDVTHIYITSIVSVDNFLCIGIIGHSQDRTLLSRLQNTSQSTANDGTHFVVLYCEHSDTGIKSNDIYSDAKSIKLNIDVSASNMIIAMDNHCNLHQIWKTKTHKQIEKTFGHRWKFVEFAARNEFRHVFRGPNSISAQSIAVDVEPVAKCFLKCNIVVAQGI